MDVGGEMDTYISNISYATGEQREIVSLSGNGVDERTIAMFSKFGLKYYREFNGSIYDLAVKAAEQTLKENHNQIKEMIFTTGSFHSQPEPYNRISNIRELNTVIDKLGIEAYPYGIFLSDCANVISAIHVGKSLLCENPDKDILIVSSDVTGKTESRIVPPGSSIKSDGAGSCILSGKPNGASFMILSVKQYHNSRMLNNSGFANYSIELMKCMDFIKDEFFNEGMDKYKLVLVNNYSTGFARSLAKQIGIPVEIIYTEQIAGYAHCFASDIFINLSKLIADGCISDGDNILAIASGPSSISGISLKYVNK